MKSPEELIWVMQPKPIPYELVRVGGDADGAYLIPNDLEGVQACFSPGVANFKNFEDELVQRYGIRCHMCDYVAMKVRSQRSSLRNSKPLRKLDST